MTHTINHLLFRESRWDGVKMLYRPVGNWLPASEFQELVNRPELLDRTYDRTSGYIFGRGHSIYAWKLNNDVHAGPDFSGEPIPVEPSSEILLSGGALHDRGRD